MLKEWFKKELFNLSSSEAKNMSLSVLSSSRCSEIVKQNYDLLTLMNILTAKMQRTSIDESFDVKHMIRMKVNTKS